MVGRARAFSRSARGSVSRVEMIPRMAPLMRRWRVSARVSSPSMPGFSWRFRKAGKDMVARQLEGFLQHSLTSRASACIAADSMSSREMP